jgi:hypothetical protein
MTEDIQQNKECLKGKEKESNDRASGGNNISHDVTKI